MIKTCPVISLLAICAIAYADNLLRVEDVRVPARIPAGVSAPIEVSFSVVEPLRDGWRVSLELAPLGGGESIKLGPVNSLFNAATPVGTEKTYSFTPAIPGDAVPGIYRLIIDHYSKLDGAWVHVRYVDREGKPSTIALSELEVVAPLSELPLPQPQRKLSPGEIHTVYECEDFEGMDGGGEDVGVAQGWTWYSYEHCSAMRTAVNSTGEGTIYTTLDPPLPPGDYKLFLNAASTFSTVRIGLNDESIEVTPLRKGWVEVGTVTTGAPAERLWVEVVNKIGRYVMVDSIYVTNNLATAATRGRDPSRQFLPADATPVKTGRTIWTDAYIAAMRKRMASDESVSNSADGIIASARKIAGNSDEDLWDLLADTSITRKYYVNQNRGCPICGLKIKEFDVFHPWILKPLERPFKLECPSCGHIFPSNDFAAGEMTGGEFVDAGSGCEVGDTTYNFIGEYVHFTYRWFFLPYLKTLAEGVVLTDDSALAHKTAVMLLRAAQQYPNSEDRADRGFASQGEPWGFRSGCITDSIWSSYEGRDYGEAYDAVWPFLDHDEKLLELARREIPQIRTHEDLRLYIEENLLRRIGQAYCDGAIIGNLGYHHRGLAWLLLALDDQDSSRFPNCIDLLDYAYYRIFGPLRYFPDLLGRDGSSMESPGYNTSRLNMISAIAVFERFFDQHPEIPRDRYPSMWQDPRFAAQFDYYTDYVLLDRWLPTVGDCVGGPVIPTPTPRAKLSFVAPEIAANAWERYRTPKLAMLAYGLDNKPPAPSLWDDLPLDELAAARQAAPDRLDRRTNVQDEYGLVFLRSGAGESERVLWAWYGKLLSHAHDDKLMIGIDGKGHDLLPDLGYPKSWEHTARWEANSLTHNTITVDAAAFPAGRERGYLRFLGNVPGLQLAETATGNVSGSGEISRRTLALIDLDDDDFYAVDLFDVRAGTEHVLSYHGPQAKVTVEGVELQGQTGGTVAGPEVEFGAAQTDAAGAEIHSPLAQMTEVERGRPVAPYSIDYALGDAPDTHLRLHQFPDADTSLALGTGRAPSQPDAYHIRYALQTRSGQSPLASRFLTLIEPYCAKRTLARVERLTGGGFGEGEALRVVHDGAVDLLLLAPEGNQITVAEGASLTGRAALIRSVDGAPTEVRAYAFSSVEAGGVSVTADAPFMTGEIVSCNYDDASVVVSGVPADEILVGRPIRIHNELRSTMHIIAKVSKAGDLTRLTLTTTALRHEGWVSAVAGGSIRNGAPSPWAFDTYFAGTRLFNEDASVNWVVTGASGGWWSGPNGTRMSLRAQSGGAVSADDLEQALTDTDGDGVREFRVYEYGPGDRVEVAVFAALERGADGQWTGVKSPGVQVASEVQ